MEKKQLTAKSQALLPVSLLAVGAKKHLGKINFFLNKDASDDLSQAIIGLTGATQK